MNNPLLAKPTVYVNSLPALRWRRAVIRVIGPKRRLRRVLRVAILLLLVGGFGAISARARERRTAAAEHAQPPPSR